MPENVNNDRGDENVNSTKSPGHAWDTELGIRLISGGKAQVDANKIVLIGFNDFNTKQEDRTRVLIGSKGLGKTSALIKKAISLLNSSKPYHLIPSIHPYVVFLQELNVKLDTTKYTQYRDHYYWVTLWKFVFFTSFLLESKKDSLNESNFAKLLGADKGDTDIFNLIGKAYITNMRNRHEFLSPIISILLRRNFSIIDLQKWTDELITPNLSLPENEKYTIIVDQVDQAFRQFHDDENTASDGILSIWEAAQTGLVDAVGDIETFSDSMRIYAAIRSEAYRRYKGKKGKSQLANICLLLEYDNNTLREIFELNINQSDKDILPNANSSNREERFFGVRLFENPNAHGRLEKPIDWLIRYTFGSPRELVLHGNKIVSTIPMKYRCSRRAIAKVVNSAASEILNDYINELIPAWDSRVENVYKHITSSILTREEVLIIREKFRNPLEFCPITYMFNCGLVGHNDFDDTNSKWKQNFLTIPELGNNVELPDSEYYIVHPCLFDKIISKLPAEKRSGFYSHSFIVGRDLPCPAKILPPKIILIWDSDSQSAYLCENTKCQDNNQLKTEHLINESLDSLKELNPITPAKSAGPNIFLFALFASINETGRKDPSVDDMCKVISRLVEGNFTSEESGTSNDRAPTINYYKSSLSKPAGHNFKFGKKLLEDTSLKRLSLTITPLKGENDVIKRYMIEGIEPGEIYQRW